MSPFVVFIRTLLKSSAICIGVALPVVQPSLPGREARHALAGSSPMEAATDGLIAALQDPVTRVRRYAAAALGQFANARAVPALIAATRDDHPAVRLEVVAALGRTRDTRARAALTAALRDPGARVRARAALELSS